MNETTCPECGCEVNMWQPIETAPDTHEDVLLYCSDTNEQFVGFLYHLKNREYQFGAWEGTRLVCSPSHWMPLPEPPNGE